MIEIRKAISNDYDEIWEIIRQVIATGDTYVFDPNTPKEKMLEYWCAPDKRTYVATIEGRVVGTFFLKDNQPGLGSHVANAGYMVSPDAGQKGIGRAMCEYSLDEARLLGYSAMQFNFVVANNERAVALWKKMGFEIIGEIPDAINSHVNGMTNAYIMYRKL